MFDMKKLSHRHMTLDSFFLLQRPINRELGALRYTPAAITEYDCLAIKQPMTPV